MLDKNPYILVILFGILSCIVMYVNDKLNKKESNLVENIKVGVLVGLCTSITVYICKKNVVKENVLEDITDLVNEQIHTGNPNF